MARRSTQTNESITEAIIRLRAEWIEDLGYSCPCDINAGDCCDFADAVAELFQGADVVWGHQINRELPNGVDHCVVRYCRMYYDSQCPDGVKKIEEIPFWAHEGLCTCK